MKRVSLHISGNVQNTGYRARVVDIAKVLGIKGSIQNLLDGRVKIIAEGGEADLERFTQAVNIKNTLINVTGIEKEYSAPTGEYEDFYKLVGEGETDERLDTAANLLKELIHVTKNGFDDLGKKQDETMNKIDQGRVEISGEIHALRDDFRSHFDERLSKIEHDLAEIKAKVMP